MNFPSIPQKKEIVKPIPSKPQGYKSSQSSSLLLVPPQTIPPKNPL